MTIEQLRLARQVLSGRDAAGQKLHSGMFDPDVISLAHGEGVRRPHPSVVAAGIASLLDRSHAALDNYLFLQRHVGLHAAITQEFAARGVPAARAEQIAIDASSTRLFHAFLRTVARPGDRFFTAPGHYHSLLTWCDHHQVELVIVPSDAAHRYKLTATGLREAYRLDRQRHPLRRPPRGLFFFHPTYFGALYSETELNAIADCVRELSLAVLEDAIFMPTLFDRSAHVRHLLAQGRDLPEAVVLSSGSKAYGLANMRIGWACGDAGMIEAMRSFTTDTLTSVPYVAQAMAAAALVANPAYLDANALECARRARLVSDCVARLNLDLRQQLQRSESVVRVEFEPQAGHSMLLDFSGLSGLRTPAGATIQTHLDVCSYLLREAKVAFSPCGANSLSGMKLRATFGCVGAEHSYAGSRAEELEMARDVIEHFANGRNDDAWPARLLARSARRSTEASGFETGRSLLEEALLDRTARALARLSPARRARAQRPISGVRNRRAPATARSSQLRQPVELAIFDVDGVLVDSESISARILAEMCREYGGQVTNEESLDLFRGLSFARWLEILIERGADRLPEDFEPAFRARCEVAFAAELRVFPGVPELLDTLPLPACVASNGPHAKIQRNLARTGLLHHFEHRMFSAYDVQRWKPDPGLFLHAASTLGSGAERCVVIEDSIVGVEAALRANMRVFGFAPDSTSHARALEATGCRVFTDMAALGAALRALRPARLEDEALMPAKAIAV